MCDARPLLPSIFVREAEVNTLIDADVDDVPSKKGSVWVLGLRDGALVSADYLERPGSA